MTTLRIALESMYTDRIITMSDMLNIEKLLKKLKSPATMFEFFIATGRCYLW